MKLMRPFKPVDRNRLKKIGHVSLGSIGNYANNGRRYKFLEPKRKIADFKAIEDDIIAIRDTYYVDDVRLDRIRKMTFWEVVFPNTARKLKSFQSLVNTKK